MNRRGYLAAVTAGLASLGGCSRAMNAGGAGRSFAVETDEAPDGLEADLDARLTHGGSPDRPPSIRFTLTCRADSTTRYASGAGRFFHFGPLSHEFKEWAIRLSPRYGRSNNRGGCWVTDAGAGRGSTRTSALEPGETIADTRYVMNGPENPSCYPPGRYRAPTQFSRPAAGEDASSARPYRWAVAVIVE